MFLGTLRGLHDTLENWPIGTPINWTTVGRAHGIQGGNAGQVAREFAEEREINVEEIIACTPKRKRTIRPCKRKLPGSDISIPSNPPIHVIEAEIKSMISSGRFQLGEECAPYKVTKYTVVNGVMTPHDTFVHARKVPLKVIRQRLLEKHLKFMRLMPLPTVTAMTESEIKEMLQKAHYNSNLEGLSHEQLCNLLFQTQRARSLCMWHDHATILKMGFIMVTVHVMYDPLVFFTDAEYQQCHPDSSFRIQSEVEQPEVYLLSTGSSSAEDQVALVGDCISCLLDLKTPVRTESGTAVTDTARFFTGDHPAAQLEQGTKQGGYWACGCKETLFSDQAHTLVHAWRSLS